MSTYLNWISTDPNTVIALIPKEKKRWVIDTHPTGYLVWLQRMDGQKEKHQMDDFATLDQAKKFCQMETNTMRDKRVTEALKDLMPHGSGC